MTQAEKTITFDLWPEYLKFVAAENRKIKRRNKENLRKFEERRKAWDAQPWHKRTLGEDRPWLGPSRIFTRSIICWTFPILESEKKPSIEEFLTWQTKPKLKN